MVSYTEVSVEVINCLTFLILSQYRLYEIAAVCLVGCPFKQRAFGWCWWCVEGDTGWTDLICDSRSQKPCLMNCSYLAKSLICDYINCILAGCMWRMVKKYEIRLYQMRNTGSWPVAHIILATCVKNGRDVGSESLSLSGALWFHAAWNTWSWYSRSFVSHFLMWFCSNGTQKKVSSDGFQGQTIALSDRYFCGVQQHMIKYVDLSRCSQHFSSIPSDITERRSPSTEGGCAAVITHGAEGRSSMLSWTHTIIQMRPCHCLKLDYESQPVG